jgi:hypothetical protein
MLELDSDKRISADSALAHPYLAQYADPSDEPSSAPYDQTFEDYDLTVDQWKGNYGLHCSDSHKSAIWWRCWRSFNVGKTHCLHVDPPLALKDHPQTRLSPMRASAVKRKVGQYLWPFVYLVSWGDIANFRQSFFFSIKKLYNTTLSIYCRLRLQWGEELQAAAAEKRQLSTLKKGFPASETT